MKRKFLSLFTAMLIMFNLSVPAFAYGIDVTQSEITIEKTIQAEIEQEEERIFASVYRQLEAQDALDMMGIYEEILAPRIEAQVRLKYGDSVSSNARFASYVMPNGGTLGYEQSAGVIVLDEFMTPEQYDDNIYSSIENTVKVNTAIYFIDKYIKRKGLDLSLWGPAYSVLSSAASYADWTATRNVVNADFYAETIKVGMYGGTQESSVLVGWDRHPIATVGADAENVNVFYNKS